MNDKPADMVRDYVVEKIKKHELLPGDQIPSERSLAQTFGISRTSVREAFRTLEAMGIIETRVGSGSYVTELALQIDDMSGELQKYTSPFEIIEARLCLEPQLAYLATMRGTPAEIDYLVRSHEQAKAFTQQDNPDVGAFENWDAAFHLAIARMAKNGILLSVATSIHATRSEKLWGNMKLLSLSDRGRLATYHMQHEEVLQSILLRNPSKARDAMQKHLEQVRQNLLS
ncbi:MAG: FadR family transcriptional regulator [Alicyclobacillus herbarius]|uniref:FadR/GntR family transcriptional regulator n=1 Tax=Alicyclobacillus herbarius TaxID=122960 RepID=UPI0003FF67E5|nr:FadR/GntR family transcriptional regulator [Alicyclobacillus herbarius]MCL6632288.1 FadR family transcriptional regulator [Alicyclobacillus herbarius]